MKGFVVYHYGKIRSREISGLIDYYLQLNRKYLPVKLSSLRDPGERKLGLNDLPEEDKRLILLSEKGKQPNTLQLAAKIKNQIESQSLVKLVIANAYGFDDEVIAANYQLLSLSKLTFAHELALVILLEQLYRVQNIHSGGSYHK